MSLLEDWCSLEDECRKHLPAGDPLPRMAQVGNALLLTARDAVAQLDHLHAQAEGPAREALEAEIEKTSTHVQFRKCQVSTLGEGPKDADALMRIILDLALFTAKAIKRAWLFQE